MLLEEETSTVSQSYEFDDEVKKTTLYKLSFWLWAVGMPVVVVAGTFGNIVALLIQRRLSAGSNPMMAFYFTCLTVSDLVSLWSDPLFWWLQEVLDIVVNFDPVYKVRIFLTYLTGYTTASILVAMTFHRAGSVLWPHKVNVRCRMGLVKGVVGAMVVGEVLLSAHLLYGHSQRSYVDNNNNSSSEGPTFGSFVSPEYAAFAHVAWGWIDICFSSLVPFFLLLASNTVLVWKLSKSSREMRRKFDSGGSTDLFRTREKTATSLTLTLITLSAVFLLLTLPNSLYFAYSSVFFQDEGDEVTVAAANKLALAVSEITFHGNNALNFYIYCMTGRKYRSEFIKLFCGKGNGNTNQAPLEFAKPDDKKILSLTVQGLA